MNRRIRSSPANLMCGIMLALLAGMLAAPAFSGLDGPQKKVESTDPEMRLKWFEQHRAMKAASPFKDLKWRFLGPDTLSGRCTDIAIPKASKDTIYVASATGGIWKTTNYGVTWKPIMDDVPSISIGNVTVAPSNPDIVWVGTGEANIYRGSVAGIGVYKSTDCGQTWVDISGNIPCGPVNIIREDPKKENILYLGTDLGVYVTLDDGKMWHLLSNNFPTCFVWDLIIHPRDNVLVIATYGRGM